MTPCIVKRAYFERAQLVLEGVGSLDAAPHLVCGDKQVAPSYVHCEQDAFRIEYDVISGNRRYPLTEGQWSVALRGEFDTLHQDYSGERVIYRLQVSGGETITVRSQYHPDKLTPKYAAFNLAKGTVTLGLRTIYGLSRLGKGNRKTVVFTSESRGKVGGNMTYVLDKAQSEGLSANHTIRYSFIDKSKCSTVAYARFLVRTAWMLGKADTVVIDDYHPLVYMLRFSEHVKIVQLWHACGAFKAVGYARCGKDGAPNISHAAHRTYTHAMVSGEGVRRCYAEAFGLPMDHIYATGVPRTDALFAEDYRKQAHDAVYARYAQLEGKRLILFAPTFRGSGKQTAHYDMDKIDFDALAQWCRTNDAAVAFKMHPFVTQPLPITNEQSDVFVDAGAFPDINQLIACSEVLITDYSSSIYEAALLGTPIVFYVYDIEEYTRDRAFFQPFEQYLSGKVVYDFDRLLEALEAKDYEQEKLQVLIDSSVEKCDGNASLRAAQLIFE